MLLPSLSRPTRVNVGGAWTLWWGAAVCTLGGALVLGAQLFIVAPPDERAFFAWLFRHPAVVHDQAYGADVFVGAFDRSCMTMAILLVVASHVVPYFVARRRAGEVAALQATRSRVAGVWAVALSLSVFLIGSWSSYRPAVYFRGGCMGSGNPAESVAYFAFAFVCLASHAPRLLRRTS